MVRRGSARRERSGVGVSCKIGSSEFIHSHQDRYIINTAGIFPCGGYRRVEGVGPAGDFLIQECEVRAEDFLKSGFFGGERGEYVARSVLAPPSRARTSPFAENIVISEAP